MDEFDPLFPRVEIAAPVEQLALLAQRELVARGHRRLAPIDVIIAACAHRVDAGGLHHDRDSDLIAEHTSLSSRASGSPRSGRCDRSLTRGAGGDQAAPPAALGGPASDPGARVHYASRISSPATLVMWFQLRSPELAEDFENLMAGDRDIVRGSLDSVSDWRLTRPADVPGQAIGQADYVLLVEIVEVERFEQQVSEHVERITDDLDHLVASRGMLVVRSVF